MLGLRSRAAYLDSKALGARIANGRPRDALIPIEKPCRGASHPVKPVESLVVERAFLLVCRVEFPFVDGKDAQAGADPEPP